MNDHICHDDVARDSLDYPDYVENIALYIDPREMLDALLWRMSDDEKADLLFESLRDIGIYCLYEEEFDDVRSEA